MKVRVLIGGVDVTSSLLEREWTLRRSDGGEISTVEATFLETSPALSITEDDDFIVEDFDDNTVRLFGGIVVDIVDTPSGIDRLLKVVAQDWKLIADKSVFTADYVNELDDDIIQDAFTKALVTEIDTSTYVESTRVIERLTFRAMSLRQMLDTVSNITGLAWDINPFKKLIYQPETRVFASFTLSDEADEVDSFPYWNFSREKELGAYNAIEVRGIKRRSSNQTITASGNGVQKIFHLYKIAEQVDTLKETEIIVYPPEGEDIVTVEKNTGTDGTPIWTAQDVGLEGDSGKDVIWEPATSRLEFSTAPPNLNKSWRIIGQYVSFASAIATTPGAKRTYARVVTEEAVDTDEAAQDLADAFLREVGNKDRLTMDINKDGLEPTNSVWVANSKRWSGLKPYKVHELVMRLLGAEIFQYKVTLGAGSHSFAHILTMLRQKAGRFQVPSGESVTHIRRIDFLAANDRALLVKLNDHAGVTRTGPYLVTDSPTYPDDIGLFMVFADLEAALGSSTSYVGYSKAS